MLAANPLRRTNRQHAGGYYPRPEGPSGKRSGDVFVVRVQELAVRPAALPGFPVGLQRPAHQQAATGDRVDAQQVIVGQGAAGLPCLDPAVVTG